MVYTRDIRVGTRGSALALSQAHWVVGQLRSLHPYVRFRLTEVRTQGDRIQNVPLFQVGGVGLFVKELEHALLTGEIDLAVHSLKDMPSQVTSGLVIAAVPERVDPRDVLVSRRRQRLAGLPPGARIGTSSRRRTAQLLERRPDFQVVNIRGNVDTRLRKSKSEEYDAIVLAAAGLIRLGQSDQITEILSPEVMLPAAGQGALAVEVRADDERACALVAPMGHPPTLAAITAERAFMARLGGGCHVPVAAYTMVEGGQIWLRGLVGSLDGCTMIRGERRTPVSQAEVTGWALADELLNQGASELLEWDLEGKLGT